MFSERTQNFTVPLHDGGHQLRNDDFGMHWKKVQRRAKREAHSEAANENSRSFERPRSSATELGQRLLGAVHAAGHQTLAVCENDVLVSTPGQLQIGAVGR